MKDKIEIVAQALNQTPEQWYVPDAGISVEGDSVPGIRVWVIARICVETLHNSKHNSKRLTQQLRNLRRARVKINGTSVYLGKFPTPAEARQAEQSYREACNLPQTRRDVSLKSARTKKLLRG